ncbi:MAG: ABC transporter permease [Anaerolineae bacterium]|nr:ABC transporter permease [Anaerolineae bacterium]
MNLQLTLAARYLWGRKLRTALTTLAIIFGTLVIFGMNTILPAMLRAFEANMLAASGQVDVSIALKTGEAFPERSLRLVHTVSGIRAAAGSLRRTLNIPDGYYGRASVAALTLTGIDPRDAVLLRNYPVRAGRFLRPSDTTEAVISTSLADELGRALGDTLNLPTTEGTVELTIVGLLPARAMPGNEEVLVTLPSAQKWLDLPERINTIEINLNTLDPASREAIERALQARLGPDYTLDALSSGTELFASLRTGQIAFNLFGFLALCMGGFIILNTFRTVVAERRHDIGMLRALGASRRTIIGLVLAEGFIQGSVGTLIGIAAGYVMSAVLLKAMAPMLTQFLHVQMGRPVVRPQLVIMTGLLGVGVTLLAGLLPALSASRVTPLEALRPVPSEAHPRVSGAGTILGLCLVGLAGLALLSGEPKLAGLGGLAFLAGILLLAPALVKPIASAFSALIALVFARESTGALARGNLTRQPSRSAITASATMIGLAIIVGMGGLVWSLTGGFLDILQRSLGSDYLLMPPSVGVWASDVGAKRDLAANLRSIPGVGLVSTMRFAVTTANGKSVSLLGIDPEIYPQVASLTFQQGDATSAYAALARGRALIANGVLAAQGGLAVGDLVRLATPTGQKEYRIVAIAGDYLNAKILTAYVSQANMERDWRKSEDVFVQVNLARGADPLRVEERMQAVLEDYAQFKLVSGRTYFEENRQLFDAVFAIYFVILGVLALPSLIAMLNTLAIGVIERTREIGMLRAIGATRRQVRRTVIVESLLLAAIGTAFGLVAGLYLGYVMVLGLGAGGFPVSYVFPYAGLLAAVAVGLIFGVLAAMVPARQAARMNIVRALRYE